MTVTISVSLSDALADYARDQVRQGRFSSLSAVVQHSLDALRQKDDAERADTGDLKALLQRRAEGPFVDLQTFQGRTSILLSQWTGRSVSGDRDPARE